jgi:hypothetical protein
MCLAYLHATGWDYENATDRLGDQEMIQPLFKYPDLGNTTACAIGLTCDDRSLLIRY